jgi:uncharacterized membrane protein
MNQVVYNSSKGLILQLTDPNSTQQISRFAIHYDPLMLIFVPFYWIYPHAEVLLIGQTIFLASGAVPIYLLAKLLFKKVKNIPLDFIAVFFSVLYLAYFPLEKSNLADFHAVTLVTPLLLWAFYFLEIKQLLPTLFLLFVSLFGKENVALIVFMMGLYIAFIKKHIKLGVATSIFSFLFFIFIVGVVIPSNRNDFHFAESYYTFDIMTNVQRLFSKSTFDYLFQTLRPVGFLPLFSPLYLFLATPEWMINLLSKNANMRNLQYHYTALLTPFIFLSSLYAFRWLIIHLAKFKKLKLSTIVYIVAAIVFFFNIYTLSKAKTIQWYIPVDKNLLVMVYNLAKRFNDSVSVSASGHLAPYFSGRQYFYNFLFDFAYESMDLTDQDIKDSATRYEAADYVIVQRGELMINNPLVDYYYNHLKTNSNFELVFNKQGIEIYHKKGTPVVSLQGI